MKDLFMCLLLNLQTHGKIIAANLYREGTFSSIEVESDDAVYTVTVTKAEKKVEEKKK